ncbi:hypothetical protein [Streptomyces violascens]|uniref:hypothetical protein n=1 Tax=Streptomyces violascens TaxID=67381 RepID=UPI0036866A5C
MSSSADDPSFSTEAYAYIEKAANSHRSLYAPSVLEHAALTGADAFSVFFAVTVVISEAHEMGIQPPGARVDNEATGTWTIDLPRGHGTTRYTYTGKPPTILGEVVMPRLG